LLKVAISGAPHKLPQVEEVVGRHRCYRQGTDARVFVDFSAREWADLAMVNLNLIPGVHAEILEDPHA
jgi:hypothetical protein